MLDSGRTSWTWLPSRVLADQELEYWGPPFEDGKGRQNLAVLEGVNDAEEERAGILRIRVETIGRDIAAHQVRHKLSSAYLIPDAYQVGLPLLFAHSDRVDVDHNPPVFVHT